MSNLNVSKSILPVFNNSVYYNFSYIYNYLVFSYSINTSLDLLSSIILLVIILLFYTIFYYIIKFFSSI